jgi:hypothetical protein
MAISHGFVFGRPPFSFSAIKFGSTHPDFGNH